MASRIVGYIGILPGKDGIHEVARDTYDNVILFPSANLARVRGAVKVSRVIRASRQTKVEGKAIIAMIEEKAIATIKDKTDNPN